MGTSTAQKLQEIFKDSAKVENLSQDSLVFYLNKYADILGELREKFEGRFSEISELQIKFQMLAIPFSQSLSIDEIPIEFQNELTDLRTDRELKNAYEEKSPAFLPKIT